MINIVQLKKNENSTYQGWGPEGPEPLLPYAGRGRKDDSNVAPFLYDQARCIHLHFVKCYVIQAFSIASDFDSKLMPKEQNQLTMRKVCAIILLYFDLRHSPWILFQGNTPEGSDTFQWPVIERDRVGGLRLMIWDKVKVSLCHYSHAPEESNLWTAWQLFPLDDD